MKKLFLTILCLYISILLQNTYIYAEENQNQGQFFTQFDLLETYLTEHKDKITTFKERYNIEENLKLDKLIIEIDKLINISKKIKNDSYEGYNKKEISTYIVQRIKSINEELKIILTQEKDNYQLKLKKKTKTYTELGIKVGNYLINIIEKLANTVTQSDLEVEKKLKIVIHLKNLQKSSNELKNFGNNIYTSEVKLQEDFISILKEIRLDMASIKKILKNK